MQRMVCLFSTGRAMVLASLLMLGASGVSVAGSEEDYAAGLLSYQRSDFTTAIPALRKAADAGHAKAQALLASILDVADQDEEAVFYYRKAAAAGDLDGVFGLGTMLATGEGVTKNVEEARRLYLQAAEGGHKYAIAALAEAYIRGGLGITDAQRQSQEAFKWISLAADNSVIAALEAMEQAYRTGGFGLKVDEKKADQFKQKLAEAKGLKDRKGRRRQGDKQ